MTLLDLDFEDADIGVTDLRDARKLADRLRQQRRLRVRKGTKTIAVLVSPGAWRELQRRFDALQAELDDRDDAALYALLEERLASPGRRVRGSKENAAAVIAEYEQTLNRHRGE